MAWTLKDQLQADNDAVTGQLRHLDDLSHTVNMISHFFGLLLILGDPDASVVEQRKAVLGAKELALFGVVEVRHDAARTSSVDVDRFGLSFGDHVDDPHDHVQGAFIVELTNEQGVLA